MLIIVRIGLGLTHVHNPTTHISGRRTLPLTAQQDETKTRVPLEVEVDITSTRTEETAVYSRGKDSFLMKNISTSAV